MGLIRSSSRVLFVVSAIDPALARSVCVMLLTSVLGGSIAPQ